MRVMTVQDLVSLGLLACAGAVVYMMATQPRGSDTSGEGEFVATTAWQEAVRGTNELGAASAPVTIVEFTDYECPACGRFEREVLQPFLAANPSDVRVIVRHWPLDYHPQALPMAIRAECAAVHDRFARFHVLAHLGGDAGQSLTPDSLAALIGIPDTTAFTACLRDQEPLERIREDVRLARIVGGTGTPTVLVNGMLHTGIPTRRDLDSVLRAATRK